MDDVENIRIEFKAKNNKLLTERERLGFTQAEMAEQLGVGTEVYGAAERFQKIAKHHLEKIAFGLKSDPAELFPEWAQSYGWALNAGKKYFLVDDETGKRIIDNRSDPTMLKLLKESFDEDLSGVLRKLSEREASVIRVYFGIGQERKTLEEIGDEMKLGMERIRQIKEKAIRRIRRRGNELRQYLGEEFPVPE